MDKVKSAFGNGNCQHWTAVIALRRIARWHNNRTLLPTEQLRGEGDRERSQDQMWLIR